ncbi:flavodoxin [Succinivibrio dextrinosolvens]|nr:flavodoxin [Succinivibrio dextrinosolvens]
MKRTIMKLLSSLFVVAMGLFCTTSEALAANSDIAVVFFSATGNTRGLASTATVALGADKYEIIPAKAYAREDLNHYDENCRVNIEQKDKNLRPEIKDLNIDIKPYKTIVLAYPIWSAEEPRIIDTFIESYDFSGKTIVPLCTSGGNDIQQSVKNIKNLIKGTPIVKDGKRFMSNITAEEFKNWFDSI